MSRAEKAQLLQWVARDIGDAFPGIEAIPDVCGGTPCISRTRIPVWVLVQARSQGVSEAGLLRAYPSLRAEDLANAWAYASSHQTEIAEQIRANEELSARWDVDFRHPAWVTNYAGGGVSGSLNRRLTQIRGLHR